MTYQFDQRFMELNIKGLNENHEKTLRIVVEAYHSIDSIEKVTLRTYDATTMIFEVLDTSGKTYEVEIPFDTPLKSARFFTPVFIKMFVAAREKLKES